MRIIQAGATSQTIYVYVLSSASTTGAGLTGLAYNTSGLTAYYAINGAASNAISLATQTASGAYSSGGFCAVDATNMPGLYRLDLPNAALASGVSVAIFLQGAANMVPIVEEILLVAFNPQTANLAANVTQILGTAVSTPATAGIFDVNVKNIGGSTTQGAAGYVGIDWSKINAPTTSQGLSGTTISTSQAVASVSGSVASVTGSVGSVTGNVGGSVASVAAAVSITGDLSATMKTSVTTAATAATPTVAAVTGNVGGNVVGSVGSVVATVSANIVGILTTALTETTSGWLAAAFKKFFNVATPTLTTGGTDQSGDSYGIVNNATYGNAKLVRSAIPSNALAVDASGDVTYNNAAPPTASAIATAVASDVLVTPANLLATDSSGRVLLQPTQTGVTIPSVTTTGSVTNPVSLTGDLTSTMKSSVTTAATAATPTVAGISGVTFPAYFSALSITSTGKISVGSISAGIAAADVWNALDASYNTSGTFGYTVQNISGGGGGNPWVDDLSTGYSGTQAGALVLATRNLVAALNPSASLNVPSVVNQGIAQLYQGFDYTANTGQEISLSNVSTTCAITGVSLVNQNTGATIVTGSYTLNSTNNYSITFNLPESVVAGLQIGNTYCHISGVGPNSTVVHIGDITLHLQP